MHPHGVHTKQSLVQLKVLNPKELTAALLAKSRQWRYTDKFRGPNQMRESLEGQLQATLNMIPAYMWHAAPSGALYVRE